ncbi:MAG TPA: aldo/keto reductase [Jatrophihabitantaceae bacterium]|jgi:aryl-alcohol dehydrogenase-like predicted oxidoreductase
MPIDLTFRVGFGALALTDWDAPADPEPAVKVLRRAVELGVTFIDTADSYALGANEELIARALHPYPEGVRIATKAGRTRSRRGDWGILGRPEYLRQQVELSLRRLRVERLDLFQLHRIDPLVPFDDQIGTLRELQDDGLVGDVGLSEVGADQIERARRIVEVVSVQNRYNLGDRAHDPVVDYCTAGGLTFIPWLPLAGGRTSPVAAQVAAEIRATPAQVALAWLLRRSPMMLPIPGTSSLDHLAENVAAANVELSDSQYARLADAAASRP